MKVSRTLFPCSRPTLNHDRLKGGLQLEPICGDVKKNVFHKQTGDHSSNLKCGTYNFTKSEQKPDQNSEKMKTVRLHVKPIFLPCLLSFLLILGNLLQLFFRFGPVYWAFCWFWQIFYSFLDFSEPDHSPKRFSCEVSSIWATIEKFFHNVYIFFVQETFQ